MWPLQVACNNCWGACSRWLGLASPAHLSPATRPADFPNEGSTARGWQHKAANVIQTRCRAQLFTALDPASQAMLTSPADPHSSRAFNNHSVRCPDFHYPSHLFRILLFRRLRLPLQLAARTCRFRARLVPNWGFCGVGGRHWNGQPPGYAGKRGPGSPLTHSHIALRLERAIGLSFRQPPR